MSNRTTDQKLLDSKNDNYMTCPNCDSFHMYRDLRDQVNSCHDCGFTHFVEVQTVAEALEDYDRT